MPEGSSLWVGGALSLHAGAGEQITIALPRADEVRSREAVAGAEILGGVLHLLDELTVNTLRDLLTTLRSEVVITHNPDDIHPDHQNVARAGYH